MVDNFPDYSAIEPPEEKPVDEYTTHERRAEIFARIVSVGSPSAVSQTQLADEFGVSDATISRDMDRLREYVDEHLGTDAKLTTRALFEKTVRELQADGQWKDAWDVIMDWNEWLADLGEQHREPTKSELDVDMRSRNVDVAYTVVRGEDVSATVGEASDEGTDDTDYDDLGFTAAPGTDIEIDE